MAISLRVDKNQDDAPPLWLPGDDHIVADQTWSRPADAVLGYSTKSKLVAGLLGSPWKIAATVSTGAAALLFLLSLGSLVWIGIGTFISMAFHQAWTLGLLLLATTRVRSVSVGMAARYWLSGMFLVSLIVSLLHDPLTGLMSNGHVWIAPVLQLLALCIPLVVAVVLGRMHWRHPGLVDLMILGFAVGGGYSFHAGALWEQAQLSGIGADIGLFAPTIFRAAGLFAVGHAVWTALVGFAIGLLLIHRHQPIALIGAGVTILAVLTDQMALEDGAGTLDVVRQLLFNGKLMGLAFLVCAGLAYFLDDKRLEATAVRDHLFPSDRTHASKRFVDDAVEDVVLPWLRGRYRRRRNGVYNTVNAASVQWPPHSESHLAPVAELARLGRAADVAVGAGTSPWGWAPDPDTSTAHRYVGPAGFTSYVAHASAQDQGETGSRSVTTTSISTPRARPDAIPEPVTERAEDFWTVAGVTGAAVGVYALMRIFTAANPSAEVLDSALNLGAAPNTPSLILTGLGAIAAAVSIRGRNPAELGRGWEIGPGADPTPRQPEECEV